MQRYLCIHGHFYQPPRENAWLEAVELQDSAYPYHDWNQRINAECYAPNATSRILDDRKRIARIVNNYRHLSFNFGPTLLSWLELHDPTTYAAILDADRYSRQRFGGHGSAVAQVYNHAILPLCNAADKRTQVLWGLGDFRRRFGREAEGMWLPETAVDVASLEVLAEHGIRFTVLSPTQAERVRTIGDESWSNVSDGSIDSRRAYLLRLPSGATIQLFFYNGRLSRAVAFEHLLSEGEDFARALVGSFSAGEQAQLVHIATDGETYGHHHKFGDMALAYALREIESRGWAKLTNYGQFLALHPPTHEVEIKQVSSWSCTHGVGRWKDDCGCRLGGHAGWNQRWRHPLRRALDWLRDSIAPGFEELGGQLLRDPWATRDAYVELVLNRSPERIAPFLARHSTHELNAQEIQEAVELLEMQRNAMLMYTSCGWFFDELSGIETLQILQYAARALELAERRLGRSLEPAFLELLEQAPSNLERYANGRKIYEDKVRPTQVDPLKVGANYAACLLFPDAGSPRRESGFEVDCPDPIVREAGRNRLAVGRLTVRSKITLESAELSFGFIYQGEQNLAGGVRPFRDAESYRAMQSEVCEAFSSGNLPGVARLLDSHFAGLTYSLQDLFRDEQHQILERILRSTLEDVEAVHRRMYRQHASLMRFLAELETAPPLALRVTGELALNGSLQRELESAEVDPDRLQALLADADAAGISLDEPNISYAANRALDSMLVRLASSTDDLALLDRARRTASLIRALPFHVDLREPENLFYRILQQQYSTYRRRAAQGDSFAVSWVESFRGLGENLRVAVD